MAVAVLLSGCGVQKKEETLSDIVLNTANAQKELWGVGKNNLLDEESLFPAGNSTCDWTAVAFAIAGVKEDYDAYLSALENYVTEKYQTEDELDRVKATEWHRISLTVLALGGDPTSFGMDINGNAINLIADGTYNYVHDDLGAQGINGYIYALITLDAGKYEIPSNSKYTRENIIYAILCAQEEDGGFGLVKGSDPDITAMALQALAPYKENSDVKKAVDAALTYLSEMQNGDGTYSSSSIESSETCSQVIMALCANGIDPREDERFIKHGSSVYNALMKFRLDDGSFVHSYDDTKGNIMATEQAMLALVAIVDFDSGQGGIFNFL